MPDDLNLANQTTEKTKNKLWYIISTIIISLIVLLPIGCIMFWISVGGSEVYTKETYNFTNLGWFDFHENINPVFGLIGIIIYILNNFLGFLSYNYITSKVNNYQTVIGRIEFILFSSFINALMAVLYSGLFGEYSFGNRALDFLNRIIIFWSPFTFPLIFTIVYVYKSKVKAKNSR